MAVIFTTEIVSSARLGDSELNEEIEPLSHEWVEPPSLHTLHSLLAMTGAIDKSKKACKTYTLWDTGAGERGLVKGIWKYAQFG